VRLDPQNRLIWNFFWSLDALGLDFAFHHHGPIRFASESEKGRFFESLLILRITIDKLRQEDISNANQNK